MKRYLKILIAAAIVFSLVASSVFLIVNSGHECETHRCSTCVRIEHAFGILRSAFSVGIVLFSAVIVSDAVTGKTKERRTVGAVFDTPTSLKVKLNN